jgi:hypothetical protein
MDSWLPILIGVPILGMYPTKDASGITTGSVDIGLKALHL